MSSSNPQPTSYFARRWLLIGVWALAIAGLYSLVLVVARTPSLAKIPLFNRLFHEALVVHVDLSVLVWFLAIACMIWSLFAEKSCPVIPYLENAAQYCFMLGMAAIALSPLDPKGEAMMSNYIPVIFSPVFFLGLALLFCGTGLMLVRLLAHRRKMAISLNEGLIYTSALITLIALAQFIWAFYALPPQIEGQQYYELLFWGGGHTLQFTHTQILLICWLWLVAALRGADNNIQSLTMKSVLVGIAFVAALASNIMFLKYDITSSEFRNGFTHLMIAANGIAPTVLALYLLPSLWRAPKRNALFSTIFMSFALFFYGGLLGLMIKGQNVIIPAHYHGSIVGITLAFMGVAYLMLPRFGWRDVSRWKLAFWQPIVYGAGQIMHISGLAYSGGYGVLRKTPGAINEISLNIKIAMGFMGAGGLLAIIGGLMFVVVVWKAVRKN